MPKKIIALILLGLMLFTTACTISRVDDDRDTGDYDTPLAYTTFRWGTIRGDLFAPTQGVTPEGDALLDRYQTMREENNMEIIIEVLDSREEDKEVTLRLNTQQKMFDFMWSDMRDIGMPFQEVGVLYALEEIETIDATDEKWGPATLLDVGLLEGQHYGFFPNEWAFAPELEGCMIFNSELLEEYGIASPYELWEQNTWNWDTFEGILRTLKTANSELLPWSGGVFNEDAVSMFFTNGLDPIIEDPATGTYKYGFDCDLGIETLTFMSDLRAAGLYETGHGSSRFIDGDAAFHSTQSNNATTISTSALTDNSISSSNIKFGIISFPHGPNGTRENVSACYYNTTDLNFIFNMSDNDSDTIGYFMEELYAPLEGTGYLDWKERCEEIVFFDERDYEHFLYMVDHARYDMSGFYIESSRRFDTLYREVVHGQRAASAAFEEMRVTVNAEINETIR